MTEALSCLVKKFFLLMFTYPCVNASSFDKSSAYPAVIERKIPMKIAICCRSLTKINALTTLLSRYTQKHADLTLEVTVYPSLTQPACHDLIIIDAAPDAFQEQLAAYDLQKQHTSIVFLLASDNPHLHIKHHGLQTCLSIHYTMDFAEFEPILSHAISLAQENQQYYTIIHQYESTTISLRQITYVESCNRLLFFHVFGREDTHLKQYGRIGQLETELLPHRFIRCHNSFIINPRYITEMTNHELKLQVAKHGPDLTIPISRSRKTQAHQQYMQLAQ